MIVETNAVEQRIEMNKIVKYKPGLFIIGALDAKSQKYAKGQFR